MDSTRLGVRARAVVLVLAVSLLAACQDVRETPPEPDFSVLMDEAAMLASAGDVEAALAVLDEAARADPTSKAPWMRKTQMHFQAEHYGAAVVSAQEVLARDPDDHVADSYLVVSSLRIAIGTLARMQGPDGLTGAARAEAERLAASMRQTLGEDILVPQAAQAPQPARPARRAAPARPAASAPAPRPASTPSDPFSVLQGGE